MSTRPLDDQNTFLALIGHVCLQWALLEHVLLGLIAVAEGIPTEKAYNYFGSMDMLGRIGMFLRLANDAKWPPHLTKPVKDIRKALQDGENLQWKRNQAVHGVHKASGAPESFSLTIPKERGSKREMDVSIHDLHALVTRLGELVAIAWRVFDEYGEWKFKPSSQEHIDQPQTSRSGIVQNVKHHIKRSIIRLFRDH